MTNKEIWTSDVDTNLSGSTTVVIVLKRDKVIEITLLFSYGLQMWVIQEL